MFRDYECKKCKKQLVDQYVDVLDDPPTCTRCKQPMTDISYRTAKVAIKGKHFSKETIR